MERTRERGSGPVIIADLDAYTHWRGADEVWTDDASYRVHYGPLVAQLAARFQPSGADAWHQYMVVATSAATRSFVDELQAEAQRRVPTLTKREQRRMATPEVLAKVRGPIAEWLTAWRDHIEAGADYYADDKRVLHIDVRPDTDYTRACEQLVELATVELGDANGIVWSLEGPGTARVSRAQDGFALLRTWTDERAARKAFAAATDEHDAGTIELSSGRVAVVWAPVVPGDLASGGDIAGSLRAAAELNPQVQLNQVGILGVGTLVRVPPGTYRVMHAVHKSDDVHCRWLRFALAYSLI